MAEKIRLLFLYLLGFPKSLYLNFRYLPLRQAIQFPIIVSHKTSFRGTGQVQIDHPSFACLKIGFGTTEVNDFRNQRTIVRLSGLMQVQGSCRIGAACKLHIKGNLHIGDRVNLTGASTIICHHKINLGEAVLVSWEVLIMDTDQHSIYDATQKPVNADAAIFIHSKVWIGARATILKGVEIGAHNVIGAHSLVSRSFEETQQILAGNPARVVKKAIEWD